MPVPVYSKFLGRLLLLPSKIAPWYKWPKPIAGLSLLGVRYQLRDENLYDTRGARSTEIKTRRATRPEHRFRTPDGMHTDIDDPQMGIALGRFGRNVPLHEAWPDPEPAILEPNPREISRRLLARRQFIPASSLNLLAAAWIQFQVHGWFSHGENSKENPWKIDLKDDDDWPERPMLIRRTQPDPTYTPKDGPPTYRTAVTHWWDGSQVYGSSLGRQSEIRAHVDGKLRLVDEPGVPNPLLPVDETERKDFDLTGFNDNYWVGLCLMHTLFVREHNSICDRLKEVYPDWDDEQLFQHARLINSALMAKIHTVEWTPALLDTPTMHMVMNANWYGALPRWITRHVPVHLGEAWSGIVGGHREHDGVPYSLTEEFVSVYRMHPLVPDSISFRRHEDNGVIAEKMINDIQGVHTRPFAQQVPMRDLFYSFGTSNPGAITLHNFPNQLRDFRKIEGGDEVHLDLAAIDILRDRERGVPRYNRFRQLLHLKPVKTFEELTPNAEWREEIREVYKGDIDRVDTMVGMFAEQPPPGFAFSETAFRVFTLNASRRLLSDRFFTDDYRPEIYTKTGLDWIERNDMRSVILRHFPELSPALAGLRHAFAPWNVPAEGQS